MSNAECSMLNVEWLCAGPSSFNIHHSTFPTKRYSGRCFSHRPAEIATQQLFDGDLRAGVLEDLLDLRGLVLGDAFLHGLRSALDEVLRFLQTERGDLADRLDDVDLLLADLAEDDRELG